MGLGSPAGVDDVYSSHNGIVQGHAYGMLDVKSVFINGVEYRMIKVLVCGCCCGMERWYRANTAVVACCCLCRCGTRGASTQTRRHLWSGRRHQSCGHSAGQTR